MLEGLRSRAALIALGTALIVLLAGWFLPLHNIISGEEQLAPEQVPASRQAVSGSHEAFTSAQAAYKQFVTTHDMTALHTQITAAISAAAADPTNLDKLTAVRDLSTQVAGYTAVLQAYAKASDAYFGSLRGYDDTLMSWTRGLFSASEALRSETWPFVEHLKLYPQPVGLKIDPPMVTAGDVANTDAALRQDVAGLNPDPNPHGTADKAAVLKSIGSDVEAVWQEGRSVEYIASLHEEYNSELTAYDSKVQAEAANPTSTQPSATRQTVASGLDVLLGLVMLAGFAAIFLPRRGTVA